MAPPTITPWSWETSNGSASDQQTQSAYRALSEKDLVIQVSDRVWNDLVDKTYRFRFAFGMDWIDTYGSESETLMDRNDKALSARRFNALVLNTGYPFWTWEKLPDKPGYTGRFFMLGYAEAGLRGDYVYGHYLLELAQRLNTVIGIYDDTGSLVRLSETIPITLTILRNLRADPSAAMAVAMVHEVVIPPPELIADPLAPLLAAHTLESQARADLSLERYKLLAVDAYPYLRIKAPLMTPPPLPLQAEGLGELTGAGSLILGLPVIPAAQVDMEVRAAATMDYIGMASLYHTMTIQTTAGGTLDLSRNIGAAAQMQLRIGVDRRYIRKVESLPVPGASMESLMTIRPPVGAVLPSLVLPGSRKDMGMAMEASGNVRPGLGLQGSASLSETIQAAAGTAPAWGLPEVRPSLQVRVSPRMSRVAMLPMAAHMDFSMAIQASEGDRIPADAWKYQSGTELTIWRTINSRQRDDLVLVDIDPKPAELEVRETVTMDVGSVIFLSRGWVFPERMPNSSGRILVVKQLLRVEADNWGLLREGEFTFHRADNARQRRDMLLFDIDPKPAPMTAEAGASVTVTAGSFISRGWTFPERVPHSEGRILRMAQVKAVVQINDILEVE